MGNYEILIIAVVAFVCGYVTAYWESLRRTSLIREGITLLQTVYDDTITTYKNTTETLLLKDQLPAELLKQPEVSPLEDLMISYGVSRIQDLPSDVRAVWDKDFREDEVI